MRHAAHWVLFFLDGGRYALPLSVAERVIRAAMITPLPGAPDTVLGALDIAGDVLPVFNLRRRLSLPERPVLPSDHFLIARAVDRRVVLWIDAPGGLIDTTPGALIDAAEITSGLLHISGVITQPDGLVLIHDVDAFLSTTEAVMLDEALAGELRHAG